MKKQLTSGLLCLAALSAGQMQAQTVYAYVAETIPASSDVLVSVPVNNNVEVELTTSGVSGSVITVPNSAAFASGDYNAGTFAEFYVRFVDGPAAGLWSSITVNSETSITIEDAAVAALASSGGGDTIRVYAHHTIGSVFPDALLDISFVTGTQLLFYSDGDTQNKAPGSGASVGYTEFLGIGWGSDADRPLEPEQAFIIRNSSASPLTYVKAGIAPDHPVAYLVEAGPAKDTALGTGYPANVTVEETGLGGVTGRQILVQGTGQNSAPGNAGTFGWTAFLGIGWGADAGVNLAPNSAYIFRQPSGDTGGVSTVVKPY